MSDCNPINTQDLISLHQYHLNHCPTYSDIIDAIYPSWKPPKHLAEIPPLPVRFFKEFALETRTDKQELKVMVSSGTSGLKSRIFLSRENSILQQKALLDLGKQVLGSQRQPLLIFDSSSIIADRSDFSARAAGINGFKLFSKGSSFALNKDGQIDPAVLSEFQSHETFFVYGFTWVVWGLLQRLEELGIRFPKNPNVIFVHGGGWKKLEGSGVSKGQFKQRVINIFGDNTRVVDYYGMIEQTGSIYFECTAGYFHNSQYGSVLVRNPKTMEIVADGEIGLIQVNSLLPKSYPGHVLLTEDLGRRWKGKCECGSGSPRFHVLGRLQSVEVRGCSDAL
jgi:hypothetical protein